MPTLNHPASRWSGLFLIVLTLACWTTIPLYLRHLSQIRSGDGPLVDPWTANGWRYGFSTLLWIPPLLLAWRRRTLPPGLFHAAIWPSIFNIGAQICFGLAPYYVSAGVMTFSLRMNIVFVTIGAAILFVPERRIIRSPGFLAGMGMLMAGTITTISLDANVRDSLWALIKGGSGKGDEVLGVVLSIASAGLYAAYALAVRMKMHAHPPMLAFAAVSQYTGVALVLLMLVAGDQHGARALELPWHEFAMLLIFAVVGIGLGHTLYFHSIQRLGLAVSAGVTQLQPVTVSIGAIVLFPSETLTPGQWCAGALAIAGAVVMLVAQHRIAQRASLPLAPVEEQEAIASEAGRGA